MKNLQNGRSMIEMLGVLAVIGVLSILGLAGFNYAMNKHRANETIHDVMLRASNVPMIDEEYKSRANGYEWEFAGLQENGKKGSFYKINTIASEKTPYIYQVEVENVPAAVCRKILQMKPKDIDAIFINGTKFENDDSICGSQGEVSALLMRPAYAANGLVTMKFYFDDDWSANSNQNNPNPNNPKPCIGSDCGESGCTGSDCCIGADCNADGTCAGADCCNGVGCMRDATALPSCTGQAVCNICQNEVKNANGCTVSCTNFDNYTCCISPLSEGCQDTCTDMPELSGCACANLTGQNRYCCLNPNDVNCAQCSPTNPCASGACVNNRCVLCPDGKQTSYVCCGFDVWVGDELGEGYCCEDGRTDTQACCEAENREFCNGVCCEINKTCVEGMCVIGDCVTEECCANGTCSGCPEGYIEHDEQCYPCTSDGSYYGFSPSDCQQCDNMIYATGLNGGSNTNQGCIGCNYGINTWDNCYTDAQECARCPNRFMTSCGGCIHCGNTIKGCVGPNDKNGCP